QIDEEYLVEATLADELGRQARDVVGRGDDEDVAFAVLQPGEKRAEDALGDAAVLVAAGLREGLLELVDPEDDGRHLLGQADRPLEILLALADVLVVEPRGIELDERQAPGVGDGLRAETLAAALHAQE